jgi:glycosyltransferase involved in cell wall biosynthesis
MERPRIVFVHEDPRRMGGGELTLLHVASLARAEAQVDLGVLYDMTGPLPEDLIAGVDHVRTFRFPPALRVATLPALLGAVRALRGYVGTPRARACVAFGYPAAFRMALAAIGTGVPAFWSCNLLLNHRQRGAGVRRSAAVRMIGALGVTAICPSGATARDIGALGYPAAGIRIVPHGVDANRFVAAGMDPAAQSAFRREHAVPEADLVVACVARIDPIKNHPLLLRAVQHARAAGVRVAVLCIGGVAPSDAAYADGLRVMARDLGVAEQIRWLGHRDDVPEWLAAADAALLPSWSEAAPHALLEAAAAGLPLLASAVGGNTEIVLPERTGLLFGVDDAEACGRALARLARNEEERRRFGAEAHRVVSRVYTAERRDAAWTALFAQCLGDRAAVRA